MLIQWKQERGPGTAPEPAPRLGCPPRGVRGEPGTLTCAGKEGRGGHPVALNWFGGTRVAPGRRPGAELLVLAGLCPAGASWCPPRLHSPCVLPPWEHPGLHPSTPTQCLPSSPAFRPGAACKEQNLGEKGGGRDSGSPAHSLRPGTQRQSRPCPGDSHCRFGRNGESCLPAPRRLLECPGDC